MREGGWAENEVEIRWSWSRGFSWFWNQRAALKWDCSSELSRWGRAAEPLYSFNASLQAAPPGQWWYGWGCVIFHTMASFSQGYCLERELAKKRVSVRGWMWEAYPGIHCSPPTAPTREFTHLQTPCPRVGWSILQEKLRRGRLVGQTKPHYASGLEAIT